MAQLGHNIIGVHIGTMGNPFFPQFLDAAAPIAGRHGYELAAGHFDIARRLVPSPHRGFRASEVSGVVAFGPTLGPAETGGTRPPVVQMDNSKLGVDPWAVSVDFEAGATAAADHFIESGRRRIVVIDHAVAAVDHQRIHWFNRRVAASESHAEVVAEFSAFPTLEGGAAAAKEMLAQVSEVDAVFCYNDAIAIGVLAELARNGVVVPYEMAVVGCDDLSLGRLIATPLSTVSFGVDLLAKKSIDVLVERIEGRPSPNGRVLETRLVVRASSDAGLAERQDSRGLSPWWTGGIVHDFNNTLGVLRGTCDLLAGEVSAGTRSADLVRRMQALTRRAEVLTGQLKSNLARRPSPSVFEIGSYVQSIVTEFAEVVGPDFKVLYLQPTEPKLCRFERDLLTSTLVNLGLNTKAATDSGVIEISVSWVSPGDFAASFGENRPPDADLAPLGYVAIDVGDDGPGVSAHLRGRIFEPYFSGSAGGTGLGLAMSRSFLREAGGNLVLVPTMSGATFRLLVPCTDLAPETMPIIDPPSLGGPIVAAIVENDPGLRQVLGEMFAELGHTFESFDQAEAAIRAADRGRRYDILVTDLMLPDGSGLDIARHFRKGGAARAVAIVSGAGSDLLPPDLGSDVLVLHKPVGLDAIQDIARHAQAIAASGPG